MCNMCNGASLDEIRFHLHGLIERYGWSVQAVTGRPGWAYTVGLAAAFGHPEFVVVGLKPQAAGHLLNALGEMTRDGDRFEPGEAIVGFEGEELRLVAVHDDHFVKGTFASWVDYYRALGPPYPERQALEVVRPGRRPRLDRCDRFDPRPF